MLADEPTGALDVETGRQVMEILDGITKDSGAALITITHDLGVANMATRQFSLSQGCLNPVLDGATAEALAGESR